MINLNLTPSSVLMERYQILDILGQGGIGVMYRALDLETERIMAIKSLSLTRARDWKAIELFEREAKILSQLNHPAIPQYLDYFQVDSEIDRQFYIVQTLAAGESLFSAIESGWIPTVDDVKDIAAQVLEILSYLHSLTPPVIHRDIKPQNLIIDSDGKISLVDFGAVQDSYYTVTGGSTVVGTYGYMAPEQFRGQAYLSTDLYGLGTTILHLLTKTDPGTLPQKKLKIDFRDRVSIPPDFADWIDRLLEPEVTRRFETADAALAVLVGRSNLPVLPLQKPSYSKIELKLSPEHLSIKIPPIGLSTRSSQRLGLLTFIWNGLLFLILFYALSLKLFIASTSQLFFIGFGSIGLWLFVQFLYGAYSSVTIDIDRQRNSTMISKSIFKSNYDRKTFDLQYTILTRNKFILIPFSTPLQIEFAKNKYTIATLLTSQENHWLWSEIQASKSRFSQDI
jgi:eukaryotic-like serine/threonine-protein kinase